MNAMDCGTVRDRIPELVHDRLETRAAEEVRGHLASCPECASELALVRILHETRARPSAELGERVRRTVAFDRQTVHRPWWALTAAAVAALALGIGIGTQDPPSLVAPAFATEVEEGWPWVLEGELGMEAPVLEDLSDDALEALLDDLAQVDGGF